MIQNIVLPSQYCVKLKHLRRLSGIAQCCTDLTIVSAIWISYCEEGLR